MLPGDLQAPQQALLTFSWEETLKDNPTHLLEVEQAPLCVLLTRERAWVGVRHTGVEHQQLHSMTQAYTHSLATYVHHQMSSAHHRHHVSAQP